MPWKPAAAGASIYKPWAGSKSIRGQISSPIPIFNSQDDELLAQEQPATITNSSGAILNDTLVDGADADTIARQTAESCGQVDDTRYTSMSSCSTGNCTSHSQLPDANSSVAAPTSISAKSSIKAATPGQARQSNLPASDMDGRRHERSSHGHQHQRKKSSIRFALGKLFGRKNKSQQHKDDVASHLQSGRITSAEPSIRSPTQPSSSVGSFSIFDAFDESH